MRESKLSHSCDWLSVVDVPDVRAFALDSGAGFQRCDLDRGDDATLTLHGRESHARGEREALNAFDTVGRGDGLEEGEGDDQRIHIASF